jgi:hypothetical protein
LSRDRVYYNRTPGFEMSSEAEETMGAILCRNAQTLYALPDR